MKKMCEPSKGSAAFGYDKYRIVLPVSNNFSIDFYEKALRERDLFLDELLLLSCCDGLDDSSSKNEAELSCASLYAGCTNTRKLAVVDENFVKNRTNSTLPPMKKELLDYFNVVVIPEVTAKWNYKASELLESDNSIDFDNYFNDPKEILDEHLQPMQAKHVNKTFQESTLSEQGSSASSIQGASKIITEYSCNEFTPAPKRKLSLKSGSIDSTRKHAKSNKSNSAYFGELGFKEGYTSGNFIVNTIDSFSETSDEDDFIRIDNYDSSIKSNNTSASIDDLSPDEDYDLFNDDPVMIDFIRNMDDSKIDGIILSHDSKVKKGANDYENSVHDGGGASLQISDEKISADPMMFTDECIASANHVEHSIGHDLEMRIYDNKAEHIQMGIANDVLIIVDEICAGAEIAVAGLDLTYEMKHDFLMENVDCENKEAALNISNGAMIVGNAEDIDFNVTQSLENDITVGMDYEEHNDDIEIIKYIDNPIEDMQVKDITSMKTSCSKCKNGIAIMSSDEVPIMENMPIYDYDKFAIKENTDFNTSFNVDNGDYSYSMAENSSTIIVVTQNSEDTDSNKAYQSQDSSVEDASLTKIVQSNNDSEVIVTDTIESKDIEEESVIKFAEDNFLVATDRDRFTISSDPISIILQVLVEKEHNEEISLPKSIKNTCQTDDENQGKTEHRFLTEISVSDVTADKNALSLASKSAVISMSSSTVVSTSISSVNMPCIKSFKNCFDVSRFPNQLIHTKSLIFKLKDMPKLAVTYLESLNKSLLHHNFGVSPNTIIKSNNFINYFIGHISSNAVQKRYLPLTAHMAEIVKTIRKSNFESAIISSCNMCNDHRICHLNKSFNTVCNGIDYDFGDCQYNVDYYSSKKRIGKLLIDQTELISDVSLSMNLWKRTIFESTSSGINCNFMLNKAIENCVAIDCLNFIANYSRKANNGYHNNSDTMISTVEDENNDITEDNKYLRANNFEGKVVNDHKMAELSDDLDTFYHSQSPCNSDFELKAVEKCNAKSSHSNNVKQFSAIKEIEEHDTIAEISALKFDGASAVDPNEDSEEQLPDLSFEIGVFDIFFGDDDDNENSEALHSEPSNSVEETKPNILEKLQNMTFDYIRGSKSILSPTTAELSLCELDNSSTVKARNMISVNQKTHTSRNKRTIDLDDPFSFLSIKNEVSSLHNKPYNEDKGLLEESQSCTSCNSNTMQAVPKYSADVLQKIGFVPEESIPVEFSGELLEVTHLMETFLTPVIKKLLTIKKFDFSLNLTLGNITSDLTYFSLNQELKFCQDNGIDPHQGGREGSCYYLLLVFHGVVKALETFIHVDLSASVQCLRDFQSLHNPILKNCYEQLLKKMADTLTRLCCKNVVHPKIECTSAFLTKVYNQSKISYTEYKVLIIVKRGLQIVFQLLKSSLKDILSYVDVIHIPESVPLETCLQRVRNKTNCIFIANALSLSRNINWSQFTLIVEYESHEEFSFWKNVCQGFKIAFSSVRVKNLNFKTFQAIKDFTAFETELYEETQDEIIIIASERVTLNGDLLKLFETKGNITVISRDYERWLPDLFFPDIDVSSDVAILLITLTHLQEREFVDNLLSKMFAFSIKYDTCWIIFHDVQKKKPPNNFCRSKIESNLWQVYMTSGVIAARFEHYNIKILFAGSNDQILSCVKSIMSIVHSKPEKKKEASLQALFSYDMTQAEIFLMSFPCISSFRAQAMLSFPLHKLFAMSMDELMSHFPSFPVRIVELLHLITHPFVDKDASSEVDDLDTCSKHSTFDLDASYESLPIIDDRLLENMSDTSSSPEINFHDPRPLMNMSLEEIDRSYVSLKFGQDTCTKKFVLFNHSNSNRCEKKLPYNFHNNFNYYRMESSCDKYPNRNDSERDSFYETYSPSDHCRMELSTHGSNHQLRESPYILPGTSSPYAKHSSHKLLSTSSPCAKNSSCKLPSTSNHYTKGEFCHKFPNISNPYVRKLSYEMPSTSNHHLGDPFYELPTASNHYVKNAHCKLPRSPNQCVNNLPNMLHGISSHHVKKVNPVDTTVCRISESHEQGMLNSNATECFKPRFNLDDSTNLSMKDHECSNGINPHSLKRNIFSGSTAFDNSSHFQPRHKFYSLDNNSKSSSNYQNLHDLFIKEPIAVRCNTLPKNFSNECQYDLATNQSHFENCRNSFTSSHVQLERSHLRGVSNVSSEYPIYTEHRDASIHNVQQISQVMAKTESSYFEKPSIDGLKLKFTKPSILPADKVGIVSPMMQTDMDSPPMDLDATLLSNSRVKCGDKRGKNFLNEDECLKDCDAVVPARKQRKLMYERTQGRKGQTTLIFQ